MRRATGHSIAALLFVAAAPTASAQSLTMRSISPDPTCRCSIILRRVAVLGDDEQAELAIAIGSRITRDSRKVFHVAPSHTMGIVARFDSTGKPLSTLGTPGRGPGELTRIRHALVTRGDSVLVYDDRVSLFGPDGRFVRSGVPPGSARAFQFVALDDGRVVLNNYFPTRAAFVLLDESFAVVREFGPRTPDDNQVDSDAIQFAMAPLPGGRLLGVAQRYRFAMTIWDSTGREVRRFDREPAWFPRYDFATVRTAARTPGSGQLPFVTSIRVDAEGRAWVVALVPDPKWPKPRARPARAGEEAPWSPPLVADYPRRNDTVIEVIDLATGRVLISQRFDGFVPGIMEGGLMYGVRDTPGGLLVLDVWHPEIVQP